MKVNNYLKEVKVLKIPTPIKLDSFIEKYCSPIHENLTLNNITEDGKKIILGNIHDFKDIGYTYRYKVNVSKFNINYQLWFKKILKTAGLPCEKIIAHANVKKLQPVSHKVHTDSDNSFGISHDVICRFLIPLTEGPPTCYFDKCTDDNRFYTRSDKNDFTVVGRDNKTVPINLTHLCDLTTGEKVEINDDYAKHDNLSHISIGSLKGLNVHKIVDWNVGEIQLFPCNILHSSTDIRTNDKWMINGVLYDSRIIR